MDIRYSESGANYEVQTRNEESIGPSSCASSFYPQTVELVITCAGLLNGRPKKENLRKLTSNGSCTHES